MTRRPLPLELSVAAIIVMLAGCVVPPHTATYPTPTATYSPPILTPAIDFADGVSEVPEGWTLLLQYSDVLRTTLGQGCGTTESVWTVFGSSFEAYNFDGNRVVGQTRELANRSRILIGQISQRTNGSLSTVFAYITAVDQLPEVKYGGPLLYAADKQGTLVVEIDGQLFYLYTGSHWERIVEELNFGCPATRTKTLTNFGLLRNEQIAVDYWDGVNSRPFIPGGAQPTTVIP